MIGYVTIGALNVEDAMPFYDAVLGAIGYERQFFDSGWAGYGPKGQEANTFVCPPFDGQQARGGNGIMIAFRGPDKAAVDAAYAAALRTGRRMIGDDLADMIESGHVFAYSPAGEQYRGRMYSLTKAGIDRAKRLKEMSDG